MKIGQVVGHVEYHYNFKSNFLEQSRTIIVWLPPGYKKNVEKFYPVLYAHDGQNVFDPKTSYIGYEWQLDETSSRLIRKGKMEEIIIVAIYNTPDRLEEYSDSEKGNNYMKFIVDELVPFIDSNYRSFKDRYNTATIGSSLGGLISLLLAWKHSETFSKAACLSSSFYYDNYKIFKMIEDYSGIKKDLKIYLDSGEDGKHDAQKMFTLLSAKGFIIGDDIDYFYDYGANHSELAWANRLERPLLFLFGKKVTTKHS
jgi:predicted alpha/beta superfamily hydrolase